MKQWYDASKGKNHILIGSRVRLARNLCEYQFSLKLSDDDAVTMVSTIRDKFFEQLEGSSDYYKYYDLKSMSKMEKHSLKEQYAITPLLADKKQQAGLIMAKDGSESIMLNEDDHIRLQSISLGDGLEANYEEVNRLDDLLSERMEYAYNHKYGYISSCPTSIGTGLRASYVMHLPFLEQQKLIQPLSDELNRLGYTLKGMYNQGETYGSIYHITNQRTLGVSESDILRYLKTMMVQVTDQERKARERAFRKHRGELENNVYRSYGLLKYGKAFSTVEAMNNLSNIRYGFDEGILTSEDVVPDIFSLMIRIQPNLLMTQSGQTLSAWDRQVYRAKLIQKTLPEIIVNN